MAMNLPCLWGSCPNFLRPTYPYTECRSSFQTGSSPTEYQYRLQLLFLLELLLISFRPLSAVLILSVDAIPQMSGLLVISNTVLLRHCLWVLFPDPCPAGKCLTLSAWQGSGRYTVMLRDSHPALTSNCSGRLISRSIFPGSYLWPVLSIVYMILRILHAITISDCIFFSGLLGRVV